MVSRRSLVVPALLAGLFLLVAGARFWLIQRYALAAPCMDQWDGEGGTLIKPWAEGRFQPGMLFTPHNEHRVALTGLLTLGLFAANGQWDGQLEMAVNAVFCGLLAAALGGALFRLAGPGRRAAVLFGVGALFVLPFGYENTLNGYQSQFYFLLAFSLAAIWGIGLHRPGSGGWVLGFGAAALACGSMATGFVAAAAALSLRALRLWRERCWPNLGEWVSGGLCLGIVAAGWLSRTHVPGHDVLRAESLPALIAAVCRLEAWPFCEAPWMAAVMAAPLPVLLAVYLRRPLPAWPEGERRFVEALLAVGLWVAVQAVAVAQGRGAGGVLPTSRYMDVLAVGALVNFLALAPLVAAAGAASSGRRRAAAGLAFVWSLAMLAGLGRETARDFSVDLPAQLAARRVWAENVRGYVADGDFDRWLVSQPPEARSFPVLAYLKAMLDDPAIRAALPADLRPPLRWQEVSAGAFAARGFDPVVGEPPAGGQSWGSYTQRGGAAQGSWHAHLTAAAGLPYLKIQTAGGLGGPGLSFALEGAASGRRAEWHPVRRARDHWRTDYLTVPARDLRISAEDRAPRDWFAFTEPVEVGRWSYWAGFLLRRGGGIGLTGAGLLAAGAALALAGRRAAR